MVPAVRLGEPGDVESCVAIYQAAARIGFPWLPSASFVAEDIHAALLEEELWVAEDRSGIAGFVSIYLPERFVHNLYVDPARHRQGIGQALLGRALLRCGGHAELKCQEANRRAAQFYWNLGWRPVDWGWSDAGAWIRYRY
jgi:GNAT superfamily N-acetyltransferase